MNINLANKVNSILSGGPVKVLRREETSVMDNVLKAGGLKAKSTNGYNVNNTPHEKGSNPMQDDDISFIAKHGMQAFVEQVHTQKVTEMREKILKSMGLTEKSLAVISKDQRGVVELAINNEIKKRLVAESELNEDPANDNGTHLKKMMLTNGSLPFFGGQPGFSDITFKEFVANNEESSSAFNFFRS